FRHRRNADRKTGKWFLTPVHFHLCIFPPLHFPHGERQNLSIRMATRRFTRLTNAFSKKWENYECSLALWFAFYNLCRVHMTLTETSAMVSGLENHVWSIGELIEESAKF